MDKTVQLYDTMNTRHSTMIVGPTGGGKTVIIQTLAAAQKAAFDQTVKLHVINPKAQTTNELYGVLGKSPSADSTFETRIASIRSRV